MVAFSCPHCKKTLKTANPPAQGTLVNCPGCKQKFAMPAVNVTQDPASPSATTTTQNPAKPTAVKSPAAGPAPAKTSPITQSLQKPAASQQPSPAVSSQLNPYLSDSSAKAPLPVASLVESNKTTPAPKRGRELLFAGVGVIVTLLLVAGGWFIFGRADSAPATASQSVESKASNAVAKVPETKPAKVAEKPADKSAAPKQEPEKPVERKPVPMELTAEEAAFGQDPTETSDPDGRGIFAKPASAKNITPPLNPPANNAAATKPPATPAPPQKQAPPPAAIVAAPQAPGPAGAVDLKYRWRLGNQYTYQFDFDIDGGTRSRKVAGRVTYNVDKTKTDTLRNRLKSRSEGSGSGTAFIINSDGILATCEHVIRKAKKIFVTVGDKKYEAVVIAQDEKNDLALLKIAANGLPVVPLSERPVGLLQNVVAVGFPLSSVLGKSVKATEGTIASQSVNEDGLMQLNANINPGNSGGPLFNSFGEVIGVCNAKLVGHDVSNVGFAVPVLRLKELLASQKLNGNAPAAAPPADNAAMMTIVTPAVAFVEVGELASKAELQVLGYSYQVDRDEINAVKESNGNGEVVVDERGEVIVDGDRGILPLQLSGFDTLAIEYLTTTNEKQWEVKRKRVIVEEPSRRQPPRSPNLPSLPLPPGSPRATTVVEIVDRTIYRLGEKKGDTITLHKEHSIAAMRSRSSIENKPFMQGAGSMTFDLVKGLPLASQMIYRTEDHPQVGSSRYSFNYRLDKTVTAEEIQAKADAFKNRDRTQDVREIVAELAANGKVPELALFRLASIPPIPALRDDVAKLLNKYLVSNDQTEVTAAFAAAKHWGTDVNTTVLLRHAGLEKSSFRQKAIELLGEYSKTASTAIKLIPQLSDPVHRHHVIKAWKNIGPPAEDAAIQALQKAKDEDKAEILRVMGEVGGAKSIKLLATYPVKKDVPLLKFAVEDALRRCRERQAAEDQVKQQEPAKGKEEAALPVEQPKME